jgi:hypothetical protein
MAYRGDSIADLFVEDDVDVIGRRLAEVAQDRLLTLVKRYTPVSAVPARFRGGRAPGTLRERWTGDTDFLAARGIFVVAVENHDEVAKFVNYPTRPHRIAPSPDRQAASVVETGKKRGTVQDGRARLRFRIGGRVVYALEVMHPGTQGAFMVQKAIDQLRAEWPTIVRGVLGPGSSGVAS